MPHTSTSQLLLAAAAITCSNAFLTPTTYTTTIRYPQYSSLTTPSQRPHTIRLHQTNGSPDAPKTIEEDAALQWNLFTEHHVQKDGEWWGSWSTYNYMGDLEDSTVAG